MSVRLARAVLAHDPVDGALLHAQIDVAVGAHAPKVFEMPISSIAGPMRSHHRSYVSVRLSIRAPERQTARPAEVGRTGP